MEHTNDISAEYLLLFNAITTTVEQLSTLKQQLIAVQQRAEELYISADACAACASQD